MKSKRYTYLFLLTIVACLVFSIDASAQRGRSRHYSYYRVPSYHSYHSYYRPYYSYSRPYVSLHFGAYDYRYQRGYFYRPYGSVFSIVVPPIGIRIGTLPIGYRRVYVGPDPYYYYQGTYYRPYSNQYEVVAPPLGAVVDDLPPGAKVKVIDGVKYYELNGTFYQEQFDDHNQVSYVVVGTDGVLNTDKTADTAPAQTEPQVGDRIETLPEGAKTVVINGETLYNTPDGFYYKKVIEQNKVYYEMVGK